MCAQSLQVHEDMRGERREWTAERIAWVLMVLIVIAALLGLLGSGPLSRTSATSADGKLLVEYSRFERERAANELKLTMDMSLATDGRLSVWADRAYLESLDLKQVTPEPELVEAHADRLVFVFNVPPGTGQTAVRFSYEAQTPGVLKARIGVADQQVAFTQFTYP